MTNHLSIKHNIKPPPTAGSSRATFQDLETLNKQKDSPLMRYMTTSSTSDMQKPRAKHSEPKFNLARRICLHMCCRMMMPFSIADSDGFFDFLKLYNVVKTKDDMPSRKTVSTAALLDVTSSFEDALKHFIKSCDPPAIATAFDLWTDGHSHNNYINLSVQIIDQLWNLHAINLGTDLMERPHTAVRIEKHINEKLAFYDLDKKINVSVKDNGANVMACARNMTAKTGLTRAEFDDYECFAHNIHLLLMKDVLKDPQHQELREVIAKVKAIHRALAYKLPDLKKQSIEGESIKVQQFYLLLDEGISDILDIETEDITEGDVQQVVPEADVISPRVTQQVSFKNSNVTRWDSTRLMLKTRRDTQIEHRCKFTRIEILQRFVAKYKLADDDETSQTVRGSQQNLELEVEGQGSQFHSQFNYRNEMLDFLSESVGDSDDGQENNQQVRRTFREEITDYFEEAKLMNRRSSGSVLKWWGMNQERFPTLAKLARFVLAIPATSAAAESAFSIGANVITARRSSLSPFNAGQIMFVHDNYDLVQKFNQNKFS